jgi:hypothetical protein
MARKNNTVMHNATDFAKLVMEDAGLKASYQ